MEVVSLYPRNLSVLSWTASFLNKLRVLISSPQLSHSHVKTDTRPVLFASELKFSSKFVFSCLFLAVASYFWVLLNSTETATPLFRLHRLLLLWLRKIHNLTRN